MRHTKWVRRSALAAAVGGVLVSLSGSGLAATWDGTTPVGNAGNGNSWSDPNNWTSAGGVDTLPGNTEDLLFGSGTAGIIDLGANRTANSLQFNAGFTLGLSATAFTLTNTTGNVSVGSGVSATINAPLAGSAGLNLSGGGTLTLVPVSTFTGSAISVDGSTLAFTGQGSVDPTVLGAGAKTITLTNGAVLRPLSTANFTASTKKVVIGSTGGAIDTPTSVTMTLDDASQFSGTGAFTKSGAGTLVLGQQSTGFGGAGGYTGGSVSVTGGILQLANSQAIGGGSGGTVGSVTLAAGTQLNVRDNGAASNSTITWGNNVTLNGNATINADRNSANAGNTIALGSLSIGAFTLTTSVGNSYALSFGATTFTAGTPTFNIGGPTALGAIGSTTSGLTKSGASVLILGSSNSYSGQTTVSGGALRAEDGVGLPAASNLLLNGGSWESGTSMTRAIGTGAGQLQITGGTSGFSAAGGPATVNIGGNATPSTMTWGATGFNPSTLVLNATTANNALDFQNPLNLSGSTGTASRTIQTNVNVATISGVIGNGSATTGSITKTGIGTLSLTGANTYNGGTTISAGTLSVATLPDGSPSPVGSGSITLNGGTLAYTGPTASITRTVAATSATVFSAINVTDPAATLTLNSAVAGNATTSVGKLGGGTLALQGSTANSNLVVNAYAGTVNLDKSGAAASAAGIGTIFTGATVKLTGASTDQINGGAAGLQAGTVSFSGGTLDLNGHGQTIDRLSGTGTITNTSSTPATLTVGRNNVSGGFNGTIQNGTGAVNVAKTGSGTWTVSSPQTYSGATTISGGTLRLGAIQSTATIWLDGSDTDGNGAIDSATASISSWKNKGTGGSAYDFSQGTAANQPTVGSNTINGQRVVTFSQTGTFSGQSMDSNSTNVTQLLNNSRTTFVVARTRGGGTDSTNNKDQVVIASPGFHNDIKFGGQTLATTIGTEQWVNANVAQITTSTAYSTSAANPTTAVIGSVVTGNTQSASAVTSELRVDGVSKQTVSSANSVISFNQPTVLRLGAGNNSGSTSSFQWFLQGDIAEVLVFNSALSANQIGQVESYLRNRWEGTALATQSNLLPTTTAVDIAAGSTLDLNNVNQTIGSLNGAAGSSVILGSASLTAGGDNTSTTFAGAITGSGGFSKTGAGTLTITGTSSYTGPTTVSAGTLIVGSGGNGALTGTSAVNVTAGATLGGSGTINAAVAVTGANSRISPGNSPGVLSVGSSSSSTGLSLSNGATLVEEILTPASYDAINVTGTTTRGGDSSPTNHLQVDFLSGYVPGAAGDSFTIISNSGTAATPALFADLITANGTFSFGSPDGQGNYTATDTSTGYAYTVNYATGTGGNDVQLTVAVPEPASLALLGLGAAAGLLRRRRRA